MTDFFKLVASMAWFAWPIISYASFRRHEHAQALVPNLAHSALFGAIVSVVVSFVIAGGALGFVSVLAWIWRL